jgi:hypothetical protein
MSFSVYELPNPGIAVKLSPFLTIQKSWASVFPWVSAEVRSVAGG